MPSIVTSVALVVCHVKDADWPAWIEFGFTAIEAVGAAAGGGGGGGGGAGAAFLWHPASSMSAHNPMTSRNHFERCTFTCSSLEKTPGKLRYEARRSIYYFQLQFG